MEDNRYALSEGVIMRMWGWAAACDASDGEDGTRTCDGLEQAAAATTTPAAETAATAAVPASRLPAAADAAGGDGGGAGTIVAAAEEAAPSKLTAVPTCHSHSHRREFARFKVETYCSRECHTGPHNDAATCALST